MIFQLFHQKQIKRKFKEPLNAFCEIFSFIQLISESHFPALTLMSINHCINIFVLRYYTVQRLSVDELKRLIRISIRFDKEVTWYHNCLNCISKPCACDQSFFLFYFSSLNPPMGFFYANLMCNSDRFKFATVSIPPRNTKNIRTERSQKREETGLLTILKQK